MDPKDSGRMAKRAGRLRRGLTRGSFAAIIALAGPAAAQPSVEAVTAVAGEAVPLLVQTSGRPDCSEGELPEMRVLVGPGHGRLDVQGGRVRDQNGGCPAALGYVLIYAADPEYTGRDQVEVEITASSGVSRRGFEITVEAAGRRDDVPYDTPEGEETERAALVRASATAARRAVF